MIYQCILPIANLMQQRSLSERELANATGLSRGAIRAVLHEEGNPTLSTLQTLSEYFNLSLSICASSESAEQDMSILATSYKVMRDGFDSWKIHFMDFVDYFRRTADPLAVIIPPSKELDKKLYAMLCSITTALCEELLLPAPNWAKRSSFLPQPWFVSGMQSLKAFAVLESPLAFRANNIFVLGNFLERR